MKMKHYSWLLLILLMAASCSKEDSGKTTPPNEKFTVSLAFGGEITVEDEPLMRGTSTNDIYGINVWYDEDGDGNLDEIYGYGLFDNVEDMTIELLSKHTYKFECSLIKDGKSVLYCGQAFNQTYTGYCFPFQTGTTSSPTPTVLENRFILGNGDYLKGLQSGNTHLISTTTPTKTNYSTAGRTNRFYGELDEYTPIQGGVATIYLKRVVFGAKFILVGVKDGSLKVSTPFWEQTVTEDYESEEMIFAFDDIHSCWETDTTYDATITLTYTSNYGELCNMSKSEVISFKRKTLTTITIDVSAPEHFNLTEEAWDDDNVIDLEINTDGIIDTPVSPTE